MQNLKKDKKVAVLGAGPSGLYIAHRLKKQGFENITVFEKNDSAGGKVLSMLEEKTKTVLEFGAVWVPYAYPTVRELINELGLNMVSAPNTKITDLRPSLDSQNYVRFMLSTLNSSKKVKAYLKSRKEEVEQTFHQPGFNFDIEPDMAMSFTDYLEKYELQPLGELFNPIDVGCGYGFPEEVPALYKFKYFYLILKELELIASRANRNVDTQTKYVKEGYQAIWTKIAEKQNVQYNAPVSKVRHWKNEQNENQVGLTINGNNTEDVFDRVIISSTADHVSSIMDDTSLSREKALFSKVKTYPYYVSLFNAENIDPHKLGVSLLQENATNQKAGHPTILSAPCADLNKELYMNWTVSHHDLTDGEVEKKLEEDIHKLGGKYKGQLIQRKWNTYFPHVNGDALLDINNEGGFYEQVESLQGDKGIFYAGGLMGFETVEQSCTFSKDLVENKLF